MEARSRPNVLLITTDQQRYDTVGCCGSRGARTPHLDALAARGTLFTHAYVQNPVCIPSRASIQTGRYPHQHGVTYMEEVIDTTPGLPPWEKTFMERLQGAGYRTAAFGKIHMMPERGFHDMQITGGKGARWTRSAGQRIGPGPLGPHYARWLEARHPGGYEAIYEQRRRPEYRQFKTAIVNVLPLEEYVDYWIAENTIEHLKRPPAEPFFIWCGFCGPHPPMDPPKPYDALYPPDAVEFPPNYRIGPDGAPRETTPEQDALFRRYIAFYWALVSLIDDQAGRIMAALAERGLWENTLVIFVTDHGEMMGERGSTGKGNFFEPVIHVPLIVVPPGGPPRPTQVDGLVEAMDIAPTILDYAGVPLPPEMQATSLRPLLEGTGQAREAILCEYADDARTPGAKCVRTRRFKYVSWGRARPEQLFDLASDPLERRDLAGAAASRSELDEHRQLLLDALSRSQRPVMRW